MSTAILGVLFVVALVLYMFRRRARLRAEEANDF
jgi:cbb3-type cytochrome oxidase subunit 3